MNSAKKLRNFGIRGSFSFFLEFGSEPLLLGRGFIVLGGDL